MTIGDDARRIRTAVRAFLLAATPAELQAELQLSIAAGDLVREKAIREIIADGGC